MPSLEFCIPLEVKSRGNRKLSEVHYSPPSRFLRSNTPLLPCVRPHANNYRETVALHVLGLLHRAHYDSLRVHHQSVHDQHGGNVACRFRFGQGAEPNSVRTWNLAVRDFDILFSLVIDKIGYRVAMVFSFICYGSLRLSCAASTWRR